jgi:hypothetical protein
MILSKVDRVSSEYSSDKENNYTGNTLPSGPSLLIKSQKKFHVRAKSIGVLKSIKTSATFQGCFKENNEKVCKP